MLDSVKLTGKREEFVNKVYSLLLKNISPIEFTEHDDQANNSLRVSSIPKIVEIIINTTNKSDSSIILLFTHLTRGVCTLSYHLDRHTRHTLLYRKL